MTKGKKGYEEGSLLHYAALSLDTIRKLSRSDLISQKLLALNILLAIVLGSLFITHLFVPDAVVFSLDFLIFFTLSLLLSFIAGIVYANILEILANAAKSRIGPLRLSVIMLLVAFPIAIGGLSFHVSVLIGIALGILVFQLFVILSGALIDFPALGAEDRKIESGRLRIVLGEVGSVTSIVGLVLTITLLVLGG